MGIRAVIDIGTNSVKLLTAELRGSDVAPLLEESEQTRLGQGFYETHQLRRENIEHTAVTVARFASIARHHGAESVMAFATSAARDAVNRQELEQAIEKTARLKLRVISGDEEADWVFRGVTSDPVFREQHLVVMDVGGGSTEFIFGMNDHRDFAQSFKMGTVRSLEKFPLSNPPTPAEKQSCLAYLRDFLGHQVAPRLGPQIQSASSVQLVGTGGTANILARMDKKFDSWERKLIEGTSISRVRLTEILDVLWGLPIEERRRLPGMPPKRADVMLIGAAIYHAVMTVFAFGTVKVSTRGLRYAALFENPPS